jgi:hypothetical protein
MLENVNKKYIYNEKIMKLLISESEKKHILGMHNKVRKMLFEAMATDVANWGDAARWTQTQTGYEVGQWPPNDPEYLYTRYKNNQGNWMEIQNNGNAMEHKGDGSAPVHSGTWDWNGSKVIFSWMKPEVSGWEDFKEKFKANTADVVMNTAWEYDTEGTWNDYEFVRAQSIDDPDSKLEFKSDGVYKSKEQDTDDTTELGRWTWDGETLHFDTKAGMSKNPSGYFTEDDGPVNDSYEDGLSEAVFNKNKIGNIGAKGPLVKFIQYNITPENSGNVGTGDGCGDSFEKCDGIYGPKTKKLVEKYQRDTLGVTPDGIWGRETTRSQIATSSEKEDSIE